MTRSRQPIVVLGMMSKIPVPGVVWQTVQYLLGLRRLGFDPYYVEAHARAPTMFISHPDDDTSAWAAEFIGAVMRRFDFGDRWAFHALHDDGRCYGLSRSRLMKLYGSAELLLNLHGGTEPLPEHSATGRLVFLETDPVMLQVELHDGVQAAIDFLEPHCAFFTFAENLGRPGCALPTSERFPFKPTRQPIVLDLWAGDPEPGRLFTTVGSWRQARDVQLQGETYTWSKAEQFQRFLELPARSGGRFELAMSGCVGADRELLQQHGWGVIDAFAFATDLDAYRAYICGSGAEFTVAKDQNVRLRTGWFSDRSASYLAAGRPVITQETGFSDFLPTGAGLHGVEALEAAAASVRAVLDNWPAESRAAREIAREHFDAQRVLAALLAEVGVAARPATRGLPADLALTVQARWPTTLAAATVDVALAAPLPARAPRRATPSLVASVVLLACDQLAFTALCLRSLLEPANQPGFELILVDNGSTDGTLEYLRHVAGAHDDVSLIENARNLGFAAAANQGLEAASGDRLVLLNNDTLVAPGWLPRLLRHLDDPGVGLVSAVTNRSDDEAEIEADYETYAGFVAQARTRAQAFERRALEVQRVAMFCAALRREVFERVGPLDEGFECGMFEDDDYIMRTRAAGYSVVCAEDVLVHHFGQATLGGAALGDRFGELFHANRERFERKWGVDWEPRPRRPSRRHQRLLERIGEAIERELSGEGAVLVVSRGDEGLLERIGPRALHFPQGEGGVYAGYHPATSEEAIAHLEELRGQGAGFLVLPSTAFWWLDHYEAFRRHLEHRYRTVLRDDQACALYALDGNA